MYILYVDESGTHTDARYFVVAGVALYETDTYFLARALDALQATYLPRRADPVSLHVAALRGAHGQKKDPYPELNRSTRRELVSEVYRTIANSGARLFAVAMDKSFTESDHYERGFEELVNRFDRMLQRLYRDGDRQRGMIVAAESSYRQNLEVLARRIAKEGHRWGQSRNLADIPYFAPAANTRLLQVADFVANAVYGRYDSGYAKDFDTIVPKFDQEDGYLHGLVHLHASPPTCYCPACLSRRARPRPASERLIRDD